MSEALVPTLTNTPENNFEDTMSRNSFQCWVKLPESNDSFYKLLGFGVLLHGTVSGCTENRTYGAWIQRNDEIMSYVKCYQSQNFDNSQEFWDGLKQAAILEGGKAVRYAQTVPGVHKLRAGHMPSMSDAPLVCKLAESLGIVLVWYEEVEHEFTTKWFYTEEADETVFYVFMGKCEQNLYLFIHESLSQPHPEGIQGFPFYSQTGSRFITPVLVGERLQYDETKAAGDDFLTFMLNTMIDVLASVSIADIPPLCLNRLKEMGKEWGTVESQLKRSAVRKALHFRECQAMLQRFQRTSPEPIPDPPLNETPHDVHYCVSDPDRYPDLRTFNQQKYHVCCLRQYILDLHSRGEPLKWPKGPLIIPDEMIQELVPELMQQHDAVVAMHALRR